MISGGYKLRRDGMRLALYIPMKPRKNIRVRKGLEHVPWTPQPMEQPVLELPLPMMEDIEETPSPKNDDAPERGVWTVDI